MRQIHKLLMSLAIIMTLVMTATAATTDITKEKEKKIKSLFDPINTEALKYMKDKNSPKEPKDLDTFSKNQVKRYSKNLDVLIDELESATGKSLKDKEKREEFKQLIVRENLYKIKQEIDSEEFNKNITITSDRSIIPTIVDKDKNTNNTTYLATLPAGTYYPIHYWIQVSPDIFGDSGYDVNGNSYSINGNNNLYQIGIQNSYQPRTCILWFCYGPFYNTKYTLYFKDEDHPDPIIDALYDFWRLIDYGRIEDIESFVVTNSIINFNGIWDNNRAFAEFVGQHGNMNRNYINSYDTKVYVSNVWNHAMDTIDKNTNIGKIWWYQ